MITAIIGRARPIGGEVTRQEFFDEGVGKLDTSRNYELILTNTNLDVLQLAVPRIKPTSHIHPYVGTGIYVSGDKVEAKLRQYRRVISRLVGRNPDLIIGGVSFEPKKTLDEGFIERYGVGIH